MHTDVYVNPPALRRNYLLRALYVSRGSFPHSRVRNSASLENRKFFEKTPPSVLFGGTENPANSLSTTLDNTSPEHRRLID